jgi:hypothetical protein
LKKRKMAFIAAIMILFGGVLTNAGTFDIVQSPDTFSVNGIPVVQNPADGVFLLDRANHRSYLPVSNLLKSAGARLTQTLKPDGSSNWDFSFPQNADIAGVIVLKVIESYAGGDGLWNIKAIIITNNLNEEFSVTIDGSAGKNLASSFPVGSNHVLFVMDKRFNMIDANGDLHVVTRR